LRNPTNGLKPESIFLLLDAALEGPLFHAAEGPLFHTTGGPLFHADFLDAAWNERFSTLMDAAISLV
jgi:hypothetical protein